MEAQGVGADLMGHRVVDGKARQVAGASRGVDTEAQQVVVVGEARVKPGHTASRNTEADTAWPAAHIAVRNLGRVQRMADIVPLAAVRTANHTPGKPWQAAEKGLPAAVHMSHSLGKIRREVDKAGLAAIHKRPRDLGKGVRLDLEFWKLGTAVQLDSGTLREFVSVARAVAVG